MRAPHGDGAGEGLGGAERQVCAGRGERRGAGGEGREGGVSC